VSTNRKELPGVGKLISLRTSFKMSTLNSLFFFQICWDV